MATATISDQVIEVFKGSNPAVESYDPMDESANIKR